MASLVPNSVRAEATGSLMDHFDTFKRLLIVYKEPIQVVNNVGDSSFPGYENGATVGNITYTPVTGVFYAVKSVPQAKDQTITIPNTTNAVYNTMIRIKVLPETKDFIMHGKTESLVFDGVRYNVVSSPIPQNFLGLQFYLFDINQTD